MGGIYQPFRLIVIADSLFIRDHLDKVSDGPGPRNAGVFAEPGDTGTLAAYAVDSARHRELAGDRYLLAEGPLAVSHDGIVRLDPVSLYPQFFDGPEGTVNVVDLHQRLIALITACFPYLRTQRLGCLAKVKHCRAPDRRTLDDLRHDVEDHDLIAGLRIHAVPALLLAVALAQAVDEVKR